MLKNETTETPIDEHQDMRRMIADLCKNDEAAVAIRFDTTKMSPTQRACLQVAEDNLRMAGLGFDTGSCVGPETRRDWEWDWSLKGPVKVLFKNFIKDDKKNRYVREANPKTETTPGDGACGAGTTT